MPTMITHGRRVRPILRLNLRRNVVFSGELIIQLEQQEVTIDLTPQELTVQLEQLPELEVPTP